MNSHAVQPRVINMRCWEEKAMRLTYGGSFYPIGEAVWACIAQRSLCQRARDQMSAIYSQSVAPATPQAPGHVKPHFRPDAPTEVAGCLQALAPRNKYCYGHITSHTDENWTSIFSPMRQSASWDMLRRAGWMRHRPPRHRVLTARSADVVWRGLRSALMAHASHSRYHLLGTIPRYYWK